MLPLLMSPVPAGSLLVHTLLTGTTIFSSYPHRRQVPARSLHCIACPRHPRGQFPCNFSCLPSHRSTNTSRSHPTTPSSTHANLWELLGASTPSRIITDTIIRAVSLPRTTCPRHHWGQFRNTCAVFQVSATCMPFAATLLLLPTPWLHAPMAHARYTHKRQAPATSLHCIACPRHPRGQFRCNLVVFQATDPQIPAAASLLQLHLLAPSSTHGNLWELLGASTLSRIIADAII